MDDPGQEHDIPNQRVIYATSPSSVTGCLQRHHDLPEILILRDVAADLTRTRFRTLDADPFLCVTRILVLKDVQFLGSLIRKCSYRLDMPPLSR